MNKKLNSKIYSQTAKNGRFESNGKRFEAAAAAKAKFEAVQKRFNK